MTNHNNFLGLVGDMFGFLFLRGRICVSLQHLVKASFCSSSHITLTFQNRDLQTNLDIRASMIISDREKSCYRSSMSDLYSPAGILLNYGQIHSGNNSPKTENIIHYHGVKEQLMFLSLMKPLENLYLLL